MVRKATHRRVVPCRVAAVSAALLALGCPSGSPNLEPESPAEASAALGWSAAEIATLGSLSLAALPERAPAASNAAAHGERAARLGQRLFFDPSFSANGRVACASCHDPTRHFTDGRAKSLGLAAGARNAPTVVGAAHSPWQFWDGRRDSLWAQALVPLEAADEMGATRLEIARRVTSEPTYAEEYARVFGPSPRLAAIAPAGPLGDAAARARWAGLSDEARVTVNRVFANVGKAIAAYQHRLEPRPARFDHYVDRLRAGDTGSAAQSLTPREIAGLRLFLDMERTQCLRCHNGPLLTNHAFHNVATAGSDRPDFGRYLGIQPLLLDEFNCLGPYSDAPPEACAELRFLDRRELGRFAGAFKTPTLRGVAATAPYFHDGSLESLEAVVDHYRRPPEDAGSELVPVELSDDEAAALVAFLRSFEGGVEADPSWLGAPASPR